jgi:hypothetical protein
MEKHSLNEAFNLFVKPNPDDKYFDALERSNSNM